MSKKIETKALEMNPPAQGMFINFPRPPAMNTEQFLASYAGYVYSAIGAIAQEVASIDLHLYTRKFVKGNVETEEVVEHEATSLLEYVNPISTFYDLVEATQIYMELVGECFWVVIRDKQTKQPKEIWMLRPDWVKIIPSEESVIGGYKYCPGGVSTDGIDLPVESVIPFKYFNPLNPYRGKGSVQASATQIDILNFALDYNKRFFYNSATPGLVFTTEKAIDEKVLKRFVQGWQENYGGRENSHKAAFLTGGFKLDKTSTTAKDMDFAEQQRMMRDDVLAVFKVPKTIIGLTEDVNRANAEATTRTFMERVITPRMIKFVNTLNEMYLPMFNDESLFYDFTDPSPEDVETELKVYASGLGAGGAAAWLTPNEVRAMRNLPPIQGGDTLPVKGQGEGVLKEIEEASTIVSKDSKDKKDVVVRVTKQQLLQAITGRKKHMIKPPAKRLKTMAREKLEKDLVNDLVPLLSEMMRYKYDGGEKAHSVWTQEKRIAYWREFKEQLNGKRAEVKDIIMALLDVDEQKTLDNLELIKHFVSDRRKGKEGTVLPLLRVMNGQMEKALMPFITELIKQQGIKTFEQLGMQQELDMGSASIVDFVEAYRDDFIKEVNTNTRKYLAEAIANGFDNNENIQQVREKVKGFFFGYGKELNEKLIEKEVLRIVNFAILEAYKQSGVVKKKEWLVDKDSKPHYGCDAFDTKSVILSEAFIRKGDTMSLGNKEIGFAEEDILFPPMKHNCNCTIIPVIDMKDNKPKKGGNS